jgi:all-trans-retinol dehydrogenase (NAD+)
VNFASSQFSFEGGANGLGRAIAFRLAREKCNVVIIDLNLPEAQNTAKEIAEKFNVKTAAYKVDVSHYDAIQQLRKDIESSLGTVDILVNNAGILSAISLREGRPSDIQRLIDVNLSSHFWVMKKMQLLSIAFELPQSNNNGLNYTDSSHVSR